MDERTIEADTGLQAAAQFWRRCRRLTVMLALLWLLLNVGGPWIARDLYEMLGTGFPFGFWFMAQGSLLLYLLLIVILVVSCERMEREFVAGQQADGAGAGRATGATPAR